MKQFLHESILEISLPVIVGTWLVIVGTFLYLSAPEALFVAVACAVWLLLVIQTD